MLVRAVAGAARSLQDRLNILVVTDCRSRSGRGRRLARRMRGKLSRRRIAERGNETSRQNRSQKNDRKRENSRHTHCISLPHSLATSRCQARSLPQFTIRVRPCFFLRRIRLLECCSFVGSAALTPTTRKRVPAAPRILRQEAGAFRPSRPEGARTQRVPGIPKAFGVGRGGAIHPLTPSRHHPLRISVPLCL